MARMFEGLGAVSFIKSHDVIKISLLVPLVLLLPTKFNNENIMVNKMTTNNSHGDKYYGICAECLT